MIVECPHCNQLLQTDEDNLSEGKALEAQCPKCSGQGTVEVIGKGYDRNSLTETGAKNLKPEVDKPGKVSESQGSDFTIPEDAFKNFRFPAEIEALRSTNPGFKRNFRLLVFAGLSIFVVAFFASIVNIVLPGPRPYSIEQTGLPVDTNFSETPGASNR